MADTAARIIGPILLTNSSVTLYTVPGSTKAIVRNIIIANTSATAATARLSIGADAAGTRILPEVSIPANSVYDWSGFLVLNAGDTIRGQSGTTNVLAITVSGVLVT
jgi:hypothetical protein